MSLSQMIKEYALSIGYDDAGFISADDFPEYIEDLQERYEMYRFGLEGPLQLYQAGSPRAQMPDARSIIVLAMDYFKETIPEELARMAARFYLSRSQPSGRYSPVNLARQRLMKDYLISCGLKVGEQVAVPERPAAVRAGIGSVGKNGLLYGRGKHSFLMITCFVVDGELEYDKPVYENICPENCRLCLDACPTGAIYEPYKMDPRRCITLINTSAGNAPGLTRIIPPATREKIGLHIHGCDICQDVCPRNRPKLKSQMPVDAYLETRTKDLQLTSILNMDEEFYQTRVRSVLYNYFKKPKYLQRNAAIALGNLDDPQTIKDLTIAIKSGEEAIRAYSAWALGRIGGKATSSKVYETAPAYAAWIEEQELRGEAELILDKALQEESSEWVKKEINDALSYIRENSILIKMPLEF